MIHGVKEWGEEGFTVSVHIACEKGDASLPCLHAHYTLTQVKYKIIK